MSREQIEGAKFSFWIFVKYVPKLDLFSLAINTSNRHKTFLAFC